MKRNPEFEQFVQDAYQVSKDALMDDTVIGKPIKKKSLYGRVYVANASPSFVDIDEHPTILSSLLDAYKRTPDMLYLLSRKDGTEAHVYEREYVNHVAEKDVFIVETKTETYRFPL